LVGAAFGAALQVPIVGSLLKVYYESQAILGLEGTVIGFVHDAFNGFKTEHWVNGAKLFFGNFYLDENSSFFGGVYQGISRHTWEMLQTFGGHLLSQVTNSIGITEKVEYWGGATFSTNTKHFMAVTVGNYINVKTDSYTDFNSYILTYQTALHEYGHYIDSRIWGPLYLTVVGYESLYSAATSKKVYYNGNIIESHKTKWYEKSASSKAKKYLKKHFPGVVWDETLNPTK
jgi:hypothetical protein